ncbi:hypothetical protein LIER_24993 [Lithospermum erythrorhizon]|uniref:Reverse transcriptase RNase H-like domain-containing protein n=1 Tax=Lithospermum erythrorhizon TaxID=34254 RepID=A0AAV3R2Z8_LITER
MEKLVFSLIVAARKLKRYFEVHPMEVITDQPLPQILENPSLSGRMVKWAIELSEFDLRYKPRTSIKAYALADFMVECTEEIMEEKPDLSNVVEAAEQQVWFLYKDGASNPGGSGAGILLWSRRTTRSSMHFTSPSQ